MSEIAADWAKYPRDKEGKRKRKLREAVESAERAVIDAAKAWYDKNDPEQHTLLLRKVAALLKAEKAASA